MTLTRRIFNEKRQYIYPVVGALLLNAAVFGAILYPLSLKAANGERDATTAAAASAAGKTEFEAARATVTGKESANRELKKFYGDVLPPDQSAARRILRTKIEELADASNVRKGQEAFEAKHERGSDLAKLMATVILTGEYRNIRRLIHGLETAPEFIILENVALFQAQERDQVLNVSVRIATYYRNGN
jgi:hypothetical protein